MNTIGYINISLEIWGSILSLIIAVCLLIGGNIKDRRNILFLRMQICNIIVLVSDALAWLFKGHADIVSYWGVRLSNFIVFSLGYVFLMLFTEYLVEYLKTRIDVSEIPLYIIRTMCVIAVFLVIVSQFNHMFYLIDENNIYRRQEWFWLSQTGGILGMCVNLGILFYYREVFRRKEIIVFLSYIFMPVLAMIIQIFVYGIALLNLMTTISLLIVFLFIQIEQAQEMKQKELELAESRITVMLSQIQPHFLYNTLTAIKQLCDIDPAKAKRVIVEFSNYLRGNLDALTMKENIPFEKELEQVESYISLEKNRFGDMLRVRYDIKIKDFKLPPLTLQTIVENAVKHGIIKKAGGGTVVISSWETVTEYAVSVSDDGVGIDNAYLRDGKNHVGMENVKKRLETLCGGHMEVASVPGTGTRVTIIIPKGEF